MKFHRLALAATLAFGLGTSIAVAQTPTGKVPDGCTVVTISQPKMNAKRFDTPFVFRGQGADKASIEKCNPDGATNVVAVTGSPIANAVVVVRMKQGPSGTIGLPSNYAEGKVHNVYCDIDDGKIVFALYQLDWAGGLKNLSLVDKTSELPGDVETHRKKCQDTMPPALRAQLKG